MQIDSMHTLYVHTLGTCIRASYTSIHMQVTIRERDSTLQRRIPVDELFAYLSLQIDGY